MERYTLNKNAEGYTDLTALEGIKRADKDLKNKAKKEIWKPIKDFEGYEVSNMGQVRSLNYERTGKIKILKPSAQKNKYLRVNLSKNGKHYTKRVHRLVAETFIPNIENKPQVNHIDGNKGNNRVSNLEWATRSENMKHAYNTGLHELPNNKGKNNPKSKKVICVTTNEVFDYINEAERKYNVAHQDIGKCCRGKRKSAGKHPVTGERLKWEYVED